MPPCCFQTLTCPSPLTGPKAKRDPEIPGCVTIECSAEPGRVRPGKCLWSDLPHTPVCQVAQPPADTAVLAGSAAAAGHGWPWVHSFALWP